MKQNIRVLIVPEEGHYLVQCPELHAYTEGETLEQAISNAREAVELALEGEDLEEMGYVGQPTLLIEMELGRLSRAG